jgi:DNA repair exonuclease SbcCD ATPase subunit
LGITGLIDGNPKDSNGAGKSSLMESICYAHYEKIIRKTANTDKIEKAGLSVVTKINGKYPPEMRESYVEELFEENGKIWVIRRGREFSKSQRSHEPIVKFNCINEDSVDSQSGHRTSDTKQAIEDIIAVDYDVFVNSQMFGQNDAGKYLMGTDKIKKEMLISLLRLENVVTGCLELLRKRKNDQKQNLEILQTTVAGMEKSFLETYAKYVKIPNGEKQFELNIVDETIRSINHLITEVNSNIKSIDTEILQLEAELVSLGKSDKLTKIEEIKSEGKKLQTDKKLKEQEMLSQSSEWDNLEKDSQKNIRTKESQLLSVETSIKDFKEQIVAREIEKNKFNQEDYDKKVAIIARAKELKPQKNEERKKILEEKEILVKTLAKTQHEIDRHQSEIALFNKQLSQIDASGKFICSACKSLVSKEHVLEKIDTNVKERNEKQKVLEQTNEQILQKQILLDGIDKNLNKINEYLILESQLASSLEKHNNNIKRIAEINSEVKKYQTMYQELKEELEIFNKKAIEYKNKSDAIKMSFQKDILTIESKISDLLAQFKQAELLAQGVKSKIDTSKTKHKELLSQKDSLLKKIGSLTKEKEYCENGQKNFIEKKKLIEEEAKKLQRFEFLETVYGLDGIQTRIIQKYLPLLNIYTKEFLDILSDNTISVKMSINEKAKVDMTVIGGTADTYEMLSGGEKKIIKLSVSIGMSLLSFSRSAQKPEIICLDEIFADLDENKTEYTFLMLKKLTEKFSRVIVISHKPDINAKIQNHIIVEKDGGKFGLSKIKKIT